MAVERVRLALRRPVAERAFRVHEVGKLGQRVAGARRRDVERQQQRQLILRHGHSAVRLAVDDRNRRAPRALPGDREVIGLVANGGARRGGLVPASRCMRRRAVLARATHQLRQAGSDHLVRTVELGHAEHRRRAEAPVDGGRDEQRQQTGARRRVQPVARVDQRDRPGVARAALQAARAQLLQALAHRRVGGPRVDLGMLGRDQDEARERERVRVGGEDRERLAVRGSELELHAVDATEHEALAGERHLVPASLGLELHQAPVVLRHVAGDAQVPRGALDQAHGVVAAPAQAVLHLDRCERRLARLTPVHVARAPVHEARLEQRQEQPLRPAVHDRVRAEERTLPVEGEAEALELPRHVLGTAGHPLARRDARRDRAELGWEPEGVEAEVEQHVLAARAAEARIGVADRVAAHVSDVHVARREGGRRLDVEVRLLVVQRRCAERVALTPCGLPAGLDGVRLVADVRPLAHTVRGYPRAIAPL